MVDIFEVWCNGMLVYIVCFEKYTNASRSFFFLITMLEWHLDICMLVLFDKYTWHAHIAKSYTTPIDHSYVKLEQFVALLFFWCCG
jgi:hypothetical protein